MHNIKCNSKAIFSSYISRKLRAIETTLNFVHITVPKALNFDKFDQLDIQNNMWAFTDYNYYYYPIKRHFF